MASIDLRSKFGPVEQQGAPNSCVAHAATSALEATLGVSDLSRLFVYYNARALAGQQGSDAGCQPRNAMKGISTYGVPAETEWVYDTSKITVAPPSSAYSAGLPIKSRIKAYQSVTTLAAMKSALSQGLPVIFGFIVPDTFVSVTKYNGVQPDFNSTTKWIGRHAVVACGFDDNAQTVLCRNSFGTNWGNLGYFTMGYSWFASMNAQVSDAWVFIPA